MSKTQRDAAVAGVSRETLERLNRFVDHFELWARRINLVSSRSREEVWQRHVIDSLQILDLAPQQGVGHWVDLGSGGGFPGLPIAIALSSGGDSHVDLIESNRKKAAFLRSAIAHTGASATVHVLRIEDAAPTVRHAHFVSARALADLDKLLALSQHWLAGGAKGYFHKGRDYRREVDEARGRWTFDVIEHPSQTQDGAVILEISNVRPRDEGPSGA